MSERRRGSSLIGGAVGALLVIYGICAVFGHDALSGLSPTFETGLAAIIFGALLAAWAAKLIGADSVTMIVSVVAALIIVNTFVRDGKTPAPAPVATKAMAVPKP